MIKTRSGRGASFAVVLAFGAAGCSAEVRDRSADTNTSWLEPCTGNGECGSGACVNGYCAAGQPPASGAPPALGSAKVPAGQGTPPPNPPAVSGDEWNIAVNRPGAMGGPPAMRWQGGRFVVAWVGVDEGGWGQHLARVELGADGQWTDSRAPYERSFAKQIVIADDGNIGVSHHSSYGQACAFALHGADLALLGDVEVPCSGDAPIASLGNGRWAVAHGYEVAPNAGNVVVDVFEPPSTWLTGGLGVGIMGTHSNMLFFATPDEASVVWSTPGGSALRVLGGVQSPVTLVQASEASLPESGPYGGYGWDKVGGHALLFGASGSTLWSADVTAPGAPSAPRVVAPTGIADRPLGVAAAEERGVLGVCYGTGPGPGGGFGNNEDGVSFVAVNANGDAVSGPIVIDSGFNDIGGCAIAWSGAEFAVAYWKIGPNGATSELRVRRLVVSP